MEISLSEHFKRKSKNLAGFSMVEIIIVIAVIGIMGAVAVPIIQTRIERGKIGRIEQELKTITDAIEAYRNDVRQWPTCGGTVFVLRSANGSAPANGITDNAWLDANNNNDTFTNHLVNNTCGAVPAFNGATRRGWNGPYMLQDIQDPFGYYYYINIGQTATAGASVFAVAAGADQVLDSPYAGNLSGNDIGRVFR